MDRNQDKLVHLEIEIIDGQLGEKIRLKQKAIRAITVLMALPHALTALSSTNAGLKLRTVGSNCPQYSKGPSIKIV